MNHVRFDASSQRDYLVTYKLVTSFLIIYLTLFILALLQSYEHNYDYALLFYSSVLIFFAGLVLIQCYVTKELASPRSFVSILLVIHFAIPGILFAFEENSFAYAENYLYINDAMIYVMLYGFTFLFGSSVANKLPACEQKGKGSEEWDPVKFNLLLMILVVVGWLVRFYIIANNAYFQISRTEQGELAGPFYAVIRFAEQLPMHCLILVSVFAWIKKEGNRKYVYLVTIFSLLEIIYWLPAGRKEETILAVIFPFFIRYVLIRKFPKPRLILLSFLFILVLFPLTHYYRVAMSVGGILGQDVYDTVTMSIESAQELDVADRLNPGTVMLNRISLLEPLAACIRIIDEGIWEKFSGDSYIHLLYAFIPRFLFPGKPGLHYGNDFGHAAGVLSDFDFDTSVSVTFIGETYLNFGWIGVIVGFAFGLVFTVLYNLATSAVNKLTWLVIYALTLPSIIYFGGTFALYFGGLVKITPFYYILLFLIKKRNVKLRV